MRPVVNSRATMRVDYSAESDQAYIYLKEIRAGEAATQVVCDDEDLPGEIVIDLDRDGRVLGFEFPFAASTMLPEICSASCSS